MNALAILTLITALAPLVKQFIEFAEQMITGAKQGAVKKELVTNLVNTAVTGLTAVSKGGQAETIAVITPMIPNLIDLGVSVMNAGSKLVTGKEIIDTSGAISTPAINTMGRQDAGN
jgi:hypothetical protein